MKDIIQLSCLELSKHLQSGALSATDAARAYIGQIQAQDGVIGAYLSVTADEALQQAAEVDEMRMSGGKLPPLAGIPMALKDNLCTKGMRTTCASKMLEEYEPPYDATVVEKLRAQKATLLGKLNMDEFAMGSSTENSYFHITRNPRASDRVPGGSSGGSAAAVAAHEAAFALGSDTGGSIRQPAAFCGVVGMKPTYGSVSRYGLIAFASSLDQIGPLTRDVRDNAMILTAIAGHDPRDATSVSRGYEDYTTDIERGIKGMKIALPMEYMRQGIAPTVHQAILRAAKRFEALGAQVAEASIPALEAALPAYYVLSSAEASSNLSRFDGLRYGYRAENCDDVMEMYIKSRSEGFGAEVKRRIMLGTFALSADHYEAYYALALKVRALVKQEYTRIFETYDAVLSPVAPTTAYKIGEKTSDPIEMYMGDICTVPANIAGLPALAMPCGVDEAGLPIGMQLTGRAFSEALLYRMGYAYEQSEGGARHGV